MALVVDKSTGVDKGSLPCIFVWKIEGFSFISRVSSDSIHSGSFDAGGYKWRLLVEMENDKNHVSVSVILNNCASVPSGYLLRVDFELFCRNQNYTNGHITEKGKFDFDQDRDAAGSCLTLFRTALSDPSSGFIVDNCLMLGVEFASVVTVREIIQCLTLEEQVRRHVFNWVVEDFSKLNQRMYKSDTSTSWGLTWCLVLYPDGYSGDSKGNISVFLRLKKMPPLALSVHVNFAIRVRNQNSGKNYEKKDCVTLSCITEQDNEWGWAKFLSRDNVNDPSKGFLVDHMLIVEAEINILGFVKDGPT